MRSAGLGTTRVARLGDESGFTLIELMAALSILSIAFFALVMAASTGLRLVAQGKQRSAAVEVANARLEHARNIPYAQVGLDTQPAHDTDAANPDYFVSGDGTGYDHAGTGTYEPLVVDAAAGQLAHVETPVSVGETLLTIYQYVTWVDDPDVVGTNDYKRLTIVASYIAAIPAGRAREVRAAALFTTEGVIITGAGIGASLGSSGTPTPTPSPTPSGPCGGDDDGPTGDFAIVSGTGAEVGFTASTTISMSVGPVDACGPITFKFSNNNVTYGTAATYDPANPTGTWTIPAGDGLKQVWARFTDALGNTSTHGPQSISLDQTAPTTPGTLTRSVTCSGVNRTVSLSWGVSTDANLLGYRVLKSTNGGAFSAIVSTGATTESNTDLKTLDSLAYKVVAYDKAGNKSAESNQISLAKNQCS